MSAPARVDVVVADDHELVRAAIVAHLDAIGRLRLVGEAGNGADAIELITTLQPAIALVDVGLPDMEGFQVARAVVESGVPTRVLLVSSRISAELIDRGLEAGAWGYLSKVSSVELLPDAIDAVLRGSRFIDPEVDDSALEPIAGVLDAGELALLEHMVAGRGDDAIAEHLQVDMRAVEAAIDALVAKLGCATRGDAIRRAIRQGIGE